MSKKPLISITRDVSVRRSYSLSEEVAVLLDDYALFLAEFNSSKVSAGDVIDKLAAKLGKDPMFVEWKKKPAAASAKSGTEARTAPATRVGGTAGAVQKDA